MMLRAAPAVALFVALTGANVPKGIATAAQATPAPAPGIAFWCSSANLATSTPMLDPAAAAALLCAGEYARAYAAFASILPYWRAHQADSRYWLDTARGYFVSLLMLRRFDEAQHFLASIGAGDEYLTAGDKAFIAGDLKGAFVWFVANADGYDGPRPEPVDAPITDGAAAVQSGNLDAAILALERSSDASGPSSNGSEQALLLGDVFASRGQWPEAFAAWAKAANRGHAVPDWDSFDRYNLAALEMLYYFRGHLAAAASPG